MSYESNVATIKLYDNIKSSKRADLCSSSNLWFAGLGSDQKMRLWIQAASDEFPSQGAKAHCWDEGEAWSAAPLCGKYPIEVVKEFD